MGFIKDLDSINAMVDGFTQQLSGTSSSITGDFELVTSYPQNKYNEKGFYTKSTFTDMAVNDFKTLWKSPDATILVKKRMFSSLGDYNNPEYLDTDEKIFLNASKRLFSNKCKQIAAMEQLTKISSITQNTGRFFDMFLPVVIASVDNLFDGVSAVDPNSPLLASLTQTKQYVDKLKEVLFFNTSNPYTTWISDNASMSSTLINQAFSKETGVMELTNFKSFSTMTSIIMEQGNASVQFSNPYDFATIYQEDIELALSDVINSTAGLNPLNDPTFNFTLQQNLGTAQMLIGQLNTARRQRKASTITFNQYPNSKTNKIIAILDTTNQQIYFTFNSSSIILDSLGNVVVDPRFVQSTNDVNDALNAYELSLFVSIIKNLNNYITIYNNLQTNKVASNKENNYVRRKLNFNFLGKHIVQPNDIVYIYINSRQKYDTYISNSIQNTLDITNITSNLQQDVNNLRDTFNGIFNTNAALNVQLEKEIYATPDFPSYLWMMFRNYFVQDRAGTAVFVGLAESPKSGFSNGFYSFDFSVSSQRKYFEMSTVILKPGVSTDNGTILDPLTPYETKFDQTFTNYGNNQPTLLKDNINRLGTGILKYKAGPLHGTPATYTNLVSDVSDHPVTDTSFITNQSTNNKLLYGPDGLVYKWKEGVGIVVQYDNNDIQSDPTRVGSPSIFQDPFANQEPLNCISLLVTGKPYNYLTYFQASLDGALNKQSAYFDYLQTNLTRRNAVWGNFQPYKNVVLNEEQTKTLVLQQLTIKDQTNKINGYLKQLGDLQTLAAIGNKTSQTSFAASLIPSPGQIDTDIKNIIEKIQQNVNDISGEQSAYNNDTTGLSGNIITSGNDVSAKVPDNNKDLAKQLRRKINEFTRRLSWKVRANEDNNLFIVDDVFDKDSDIDIFYKDLAGNLQLYSNTQEKVLSKIKQVVEILNIEFFFDSQGHIRVRTPQYNRMPSSVFNKMIKTKQDTGISMFPQFIDDMIKNQVKYLIDSIEVEEDYVRILGCLAGKTTDEDIRQWLNFNYSTLFLSTEPTPQNNYSSTIISFANVLDDVADPSSSIQINNLDTLSKSNPITLNSKIDAIKNFFDKSNNKNLVAQGQSTDSAISLNNQKINSLQQNILTKTGQQFQVGDYISNQSANVFAIAANNSINIIKILEDVSTHLANRQNYAKQLSSAIKNYQDSKSIDTDTNMQAKVMYQKTNNADIPPMFENIIEDENYDDLGPNSGMRYVIKNEHIKSLYINENEPRTNFIVVTGSVSNYESLSKFDSGNYLFGSGSNGLISAEAIDYDLWRLYGLKDAMTVQAPYFHDVKNQCAPYAAMLLNRQKRNILQGNCTLAGNEFMQAGEVYYVEPKNMLFYVESVSHHYSWNSFNTSLNLSYGHLPGEYIPNPYDIIGKVLYNNRYDNSLTNFRETSNRQEVALGAYPNIFDLGKFAYIPFSEYNKNLEKIINNILQQSALFAYRSNFGDSNTAIVPKVKLRYYTNSNLFPTSYSPADAATEIANILTGKTSKIKLQETPKIILQPDSVIIEPVDLNDKNNPKSPSKFAMNLADNLKNNINQSFQQKTTTQTNQSLISQNAKDNAKDNHSNDIDASMAQGSQANETNQIELSLLRYVIDIFIEFVQTDKDALLAKQNKQQVDAANAAGMGAANASNQANEQGSENAAAQAHYQSMINAQNKGVS
jgi:hypothetical protein